MECPNCGSAQVKLLPPSQISPHPGFRCADCGILMRSRGMQFIYVVAFLLGLAFFAGAVAARFFLEEIGLPIRAIALGIAGVAVAVNSVRQIARPVPRRSRDG